MKGSHKKTNISLERQRYFDAQELWRNLCKNPPDSAFDLFTTIYPDIVPEGFDSGDHDLEAKHKRRIGREAIYGRKGLGGVVGNLRVLVGQPLEHRVIHLGKVKTLRRFEFNPHALTDRATNDELKSELKRLLPFPCVVYLHQSELGRKNHLHVLEAPGITDLGSCCGVVEDDDLQTKAGYLGRHQYWEQLLADTFAVDKAKLPMWVDGKGKEHRGRMPSDSFSIGCNASIPLSEIVRVFGPCPVKGKRFKERKTQRQEEKQNSVLFANPELIAAANLPLLRDGTPESVVLITRLHKAWVSGTFDNAPGYIGIGRTKNLGASLGSYFNRNWLSPGEVADLESTALALNLHVTEIAPHLEMNSLALVRSHISGGFAAPQNFTSVS
jgi:hypothetical protein